MKYDQKLRIFKQKIKLNNVSSFDNTKHLEMNVVVSNIVSNVTCECNNADCRV